MLQINNTAVESGLARHSSLKAFGLSEGDLDAKECTIACPRHGAKFDIRSGAALTMPATQATEAFEVKVEGDEVFVKVSD